MSESLAIEFQDLSVSFSSRRVLTGLSLAVPRGRKVLITGPSGCGKSTLLHCVLGFVKPLSGRVVVQDQPVGPESIWEIRQKLGYVDQEPQLGPGSVRQILHEPMGYRANAHLAENLSRVPEWFERFELGGELLDAQVSKLSGGEKQRVALISAMLLERPILLLDEATSALDPSTRRRVIRTLGQCEETTILAVGHDSAWQELADREISLAREVVE